MFRIGSSPQISIMVLYAIALHFIWASIIMSDVSAVNVTAVAALWHYIPNQRVLSTTLIMVALAATLGLFTHRPWIVLLLIPQQIILLASASGAIEAIWLSQFADGVVRSRAFMAADQIYSILAAIGHTVAIAAHARRVSRYER